MRRVQEISRKLLTSLLLSSIWLLFGSNITSIGQTLHPLPHPNHYIVLIDASGSTQTTEAKRRAYNAALFESLLPRLYSEGFGTYVPPYDPKEDFLTLHHFGVVVGERATAYNRLADSNLLTDFIHPSWVLRKGIDQDALRKNLMSHQFYQYTVLSWAKQLALKSSQAQSPDTITGRTFLLFVHDGDPNEHSPSEEIDMVRRWAKTSFEETSPIIGSIDSDYRFTDGKGNNRPAWEQAVTGGAEQMRPSMFLEVYEVVSRDEASWESEGRSLDPLADFRFRWTKETGEMPEGLLNWRLNDSFKAWESHADTQDVLTEVRSEGKSTIIQGLNAPVIFQGSLSCTPRTFEGGIKLTLRRSDKYLGSRLLDYSYLRSITTPPPLRCTLGFIGKSTLAALLIAFALAALLYYLYFRFLTTHLRIELPATLGSIRISRKGKIRVEVSALPQKDLEVLTLKLPGILSQHILYRDASITVHTEPDKFVRWSNEWNGSELRLPIAQEYRWANWLVIPSKPCVVSVIFEQGTQRMEILLSYPAGTLEHPLVAKEQRNER